jgi:CRP-like cAMP-binding protein
MLRAQPELSGAEHRSVPFERTSAFGLNNHRPDPSVLLLDTLYETLPRAAPGTRAAIEQAADVVTFSADRTILRQGDDTSLALVLAGHVAYRRSTADGQQLILRIVKRGGFAAILPIGGRPAAGDAIALTETSVALWHGRAIRALAASDPGLSADLLDLAVATLEEVVGRLDGLFHQEALRRVARVLDLHADLFFAEPPVLRRAHLPALVGTSREMTGRVMRLLESQGLIARVGRDRLDLLDPAGLAAAADSRTR